MKKANGSEKSPVSTAVVAAAGKGTRMWPTTPIIPKELLPLWNIPALLHLVLEFADAGITNVIVVAAPHNHRFIAELFDPSNCAPSKMLHDPLVRRLQDTLARCSVSIIEQSNNYGNGTPLRLVMERYGLQPYVYAFGDDVVIGENATLGLMDVYARTGNPVLGGQEVAPERKSSFGILECETRDGLDYITRVLEKPTPSQTASNIASFGRYLVTPPVLRMLNAIGPGKDGEIWFIDAIIAYLQAGGEACTFRPSRGKWHTVGDPKGYADAVCAAARENLAGGRPGRAFRSPAVAREFSLTSDLDADTIGPDRNQITRRMNEMTSLSTILAAIEASTEKIKTLEADLATERENGRTLVEQYRAQSADALKTLGIAEEPRKQRKPRSQQAVLMSAASRTIRQTVKGGEKNAKTILAAALEAAEKIAKAKLNLIEVPAEIKTKIEERVKTLAAKK